MLPWHVIAPAMISPFFVTFGAAVLPGERVGINRWVAAGNGFFGAMIQPWESGFTTAILLLIAASMTWSCASLVTMRLTQNVPKDAITVLLLTQVDRLWSERNRTVGAALA